MKNFIIKVGLTYIPNSSIAYIGIKEELSYISFGKKYNLIIKTTDGTTHIVGSMADSVEAFNDFLSKVFENYDSNLIEYVENTNQKVNAEKEKKEKSKKEIEPEVFAELKDRDDLPKKETSIDIIPVDIPVPKTAEELNDLADKVDKEIKKTKSKSKSKKSTNG